jgi:hypothetical protein
MEADFLDDFLTAVKALEKHRVDYVLVGGFAVILHGLPRLTQDMDIFVKLVPENVESLKRALKDAFHDSSIEEITPAELGRYPVIRYGTPGGFVIDIMTKVGEMFKFEDLEFELVEFEGQKIKVATPATLFRMKKDTLRDKDKADSVFLKKLIDARQGKT